MQERGLTCCGEVKKHGEIHPQYLKAEGRGSAHIMTIFGR